MIQSEIFKARKNNTFLSDQTLEGYKDYIELLKSEVGKSLSFAWQNQIDFTHRLINNEIRNNLSR
jgi:hypothetical protein